MRGSTAGITDGLQGQSKAHYWLLSILDILIGTLIITPLVITYWRGTWGLFDTYVFPDSPLFSALTSVGIGFGILFIFNVFQKKIKETLNPDIHRLVYYILSRLYTKLFSIACVNSWRGMWRTLDILLDSKNSQLTALSVVFAFIFLIPMKTLRNLSAPPFAIVTDRYQGYFDVPTLFRVRVSVVTEDNCKSVSHTNDSTRKSPFISPTENILEDARLFFLNHQSKKIPCFSISINIIRPCL